MRPGAYKLTQDVQNPNADRRMKSWTARPVIFAGAVFVINVYNRITMRGERYGDIPIDGEFGKLIVKSLQPEQEDVSTIMRKYDAHQWHVAAIPELLVRRGIITLEQLDQALEAERKKEEEE